MIYLSELRLQNFRSHVDKVVRFKDKVNVIVGQNGVGKTNLLEAIYYFSLGTSFRTAVRKNLVNFHADDFSIMEVVNMNDKKISGSVTFSDKKSDTLPLKVIAFSPESTNIIDGDPKIRRNFIDAIILQYDVKYRKILMELNHTTKQRATLFKGNDLAMIEHWDEKYATLSENITLKRQKLILSVNKHIDKIYKSIAGQAQTLQVDLVTTPSNVEIKEIVRELENTREKERILGWTNVGAKGDDIVFILNGEPAKCTGSYGEKWSLMISFVLAVWEILNEKGSKFENIEPLLLLDDAFTGLDAKRRQKLVKLIQGVNQTIITTANVQDIPKMCYNRIKL
ncbi:MAG: DNA replication and repair protein RecF [Candidatus Ancillula sp.]|jgi:DNA replication and repair protein RecF|nr:DNA replication and repair protein RecF [Candidatus Ancillula sp.]